MTSEQPLAAAGSATADVDAVRTVMQQLQDEWRRRDIAAYIDHFTEDADIVNRSGGWLRGKAAIQQQFSRLAEHGLPEIFTATMTVEAIRPVTADVVIVHERREESERKSLATLVLAKREGRWWVQSISIAPIETLPGRQPPA